MADLYFCDLYRNKVCFELTNLSFFVRLSHLENVAASAFTSSISSPLARRVST